MVNGCPLWQSSPRAAEAFGLLKMDYSRPISELSQGEGNHKGCPYVGLACNYKGCPYVGLEGNHKGCPYAGFESNHKGCPYVGLAGVRFHFGDRLR